MAQAQTKKSTITECTKFKICNVDKKGKGMIATSKIHQGELIYTEPPLMTVDRSSNQLLSQQIEQQFNQLSFANQQIFRNLAYQETASKVDIFRTNAISNRVQHKRALSHLFPIICRANHSCNANAHWKWNDEASKEQLIAAFDIECGDEICVSYLGMNTVLTHDIRQQLLHRNWGFQCQCDLCGKTEEQRKSMDAWIQDRQDLLMKASKCCDVEQRYAIVLELIKITEQRFDSHPLFLFQHHFEAFKCCVRSESPKLCECAEYHRTECVQFFAKFMGKGTCLPSHVECWINQATQ